MTYCNSSLHRKWSSNSTSNLWFGAGDVSQRPKTHRKLLNRRMIACSSLSGKSGCNDSFFHVSWVTECLVKSNPTGEWEPYFRPDKLNCTCELKQRSQKYVGYNKTRFSVISVHIKRAGHPLLLNSKGRKILASFATWTWAVTHLLLRDVT